MVDWSALHNLPVCLLPRPFITVAHFKTPQPALLYALLSSMTRWLIRIFCFVAVLFNGAHAAYARKIENGNGPNPALCSDEKVCFFAITDHGSNRFTWSPFWSEYVREAKKRRLSCGVKVTPLSRLVKQFIALSKEEKKDPVKISR